MSYHTEIPGMLEMVPRPAFGVRNGTIIYCNEAAQKLMLPQNVPISELLGEGIQDYAEFREGCLFLAVYHCGNELPFSITKMNDCDLFILEQDAEEAELRTMSLIAEKLRAPLFETMLCANSILPVLQQLDTPDMAGQGEQLNRSLHQMHRMICNMSDVLQYSGGVSNAKVYRDIVGFTAELMAHMASLVEACGVHLEYSVPNELISCLYDEHLLERALYNMVSNAVKQSKVGDTLQFRLSRIDRRLLFSLCDHGSGFDTAVLTNAFHRYRRSPGLETPSTGLGLGLALVRCAAMAHGGTVLIDHPEENGTRVTLSIAITHPRVVPTRSPISRLDYAGGKDHGLLELSDVLPLEFYKSK